jgi:hypothetical protein
LKIIKEIEDIQNTACRGLPPLLPPLHPGSFLADDLYIPEALSPERTNLNIAFAGQLY